jgi:2-dehydropantoate 2-reductase
VKVGVMGAGAIGGYLGGRLRAAGVPVVLVGRQALAEQTGTRGLRLTALDGYDRTLRPGELEVATTPAPLSDCDVVLVTVKSGATVAAARQLKPHLRDDATVVSFQNGVRNPSLLAAELGPRVLAAMVPFNVVWRADGHLHQGTSGVLHLEAGPRALPLLDALNRAGLPTRDEIDMRAVLWGKLLLNLNNPINALAGVPLRDELSTRAYRRVLAACQREALAALAQAGIAAQLGMPMPPALLPGLLRLPNFLFRVIARSMIRIDPQARSSMWEDLERRRPTEVDALNGEVVRLAEAAGLPAPANATVMALVRQAEGRGSPRLDAATLLRHVDEAWRAAGADRMLRP